MAPQAALGGRQDDIIRSTAELVRYSQHYYHEQKVFFTDTQGTADGLG